MDSDPGYDQQMGEKEVCILRTGNEDSLNRTLAF